MLKSDCGTLRFKHLKNLNLKCTERRKTEDKPVDCKPGKFPSFGRYLWVEPACERRLI